MSLQDTIDTIKQIVDKIENATLLEQEESVIYNIVPNTANKEDLPEINEDIYKTLLQQTHEQFSERKITAEKKINELEELNNNIAQIQSRIDFIENYVKRKAYDSKPHLLKQLEEKENCVFAWMLLTNVKFDYSSENIAGYHYNRKNGKYVTFNIAKDLDSTEKLWSVIKNNMKNHV